MQLRILPFVFLILSAMTLPAQDKPSFKFGKIGPDDFKTRVYDVDSSANAVVLSDIGVSKIIGNNKGGLSLEFTHFKRVHILNKNGYDLADVELRLYTIGEKEEKIEKLKAVTYNLVGNRVVETKLEKDALFKDQISKNWLANKFTFPNLAEGSIIEMEYVKVSDFLWNLEPWQFQGKYPVLWSEYKFALPSFFNYVFISTGYRSFDVKDSKADRQSFAVSNSNGTGASQNYHFSTAVTNYRWAMKNIPPLKMESYTSTLANHMSKIEFQLVEQNEPLEYRRYLDTWQNFTKQLLEAEYFGVQLDKDNGFLNDLINQAIAGATSDLEKAHRIYDFVRDNYTCTNYNRTTMDQNLRVVARSRHGNVAEINLLLTAMLKHENIEADPVLLSTRSHGYPYPGYPLPEKFNYVICRATIDGRNYFLDASKARLGFNKLGYECYNGHARAVNERADSLNFSTDSLLEKSLTSVIIINTNEGGLSGSVMQSPGYYQSYNIRSQIKDNGKEQYFNDIKKTIGSEVTVSEPNVDSLEKYDFPISLRYKFELPSAGEDIMYLNPMLSEGWKDNPFKSEQRFYPVEMPYTLDETYVFRMDVPVGYIVDELPKQITVKMNEAGDGTFEYRISESNGVISLRSRLRVGRSYFLPEEYEMLREFFNLVVKKHAEQIVFKKKTS